MNISIAVYKDNFIYKEKVKSISREYFAVKWLRYVGWSRLFYRKIFFCLMGEG